MWIDGESVGAFFTPGQSPSWDGIAVVEDYNVQAIRIWGWVAFYAETPGIFGYQIGDAEPVFDEGFALEAEQPVVDAAVAQGGKSAARMKIFVPVEYLSGEEIVIKALAKDAVGTVETICEFKLSKPVNPNAPVVFLNASDMAATIPGSPDITSAEMSADGNYITINTGNTNDDAFHDPYYQLPMLNGKGTVANFVVIKYRTSVAGARSEVFIGSGAGPNGQGDNFTFDIETDGKWHLAVIDLSNIAAVVDGVINYLRWDPYVGDQEGASIDMGYIAAFQSAEAAIAWDAQFADKFIDIYNVPQDIWAVSGHKTGVTPSDDATHGGMVAAGGIASGALLHQGSVGIGELNLAQYSKMIIYYGVDNSQVTLDHWAASANNRFMITSADTHMNNSPAEETIVASVDYQPTGWALTAIEIDLTGVDYNGPVFVSYDTLPGTFMLIGAIELVYDNNYVEPETPAEDPSFAVSFYQANKGATYYFTGAMNGYYLATSTNAADAAKVFVETHEQGLRMYVLVDDVKTYVEIYEYENKGQMKGGVRMTTEPTTYFVFNADANTYVTDLGDTGIFYLGTYGTFETISASKISYITGSNAANVGVSQFPIEWVEYPVAQ